MPQSQPRQHTGPNDMQMLQRQVMIKKLLELRRHNQLQELGDGRQQIHLNQLSATNKQAAGGQFSSPTSGSPIDDASQLSLFDNLNFGQSDKLPSLQGFPDGIRSQDKTQDLHLRNLEPQHLEVSSDGTCVERSRSGLNMYSELHGLSHDSTNVFIGYSDNANPSVMQSSHLTNTCRGDNNNNVSSNHLYLADGGSFSSGGQDLTGWLGGYAGTTMQCNPPSASKTLDPLEQKFLFGVDASSGRDADIVTGSDKISKSAEYLSSFSSIQSGSWSALMQSAVAVAPTGSQKTELSTDIHQPNRLDSGHQQTVWVGNNVQSHSPLDGKPQHLSNDSKLSSGFPGFQSLNQDIGERKTVKPFENAWSDGPGQVLEHSERIVPPQSIFSYNTQQSTTCPAGSSHLENHLKISHLPAPTAATQTPPATLLGTESKHLHFYPATSRGISHQTSFNPFGQQFPTLESMPVSQQSPVSGLYQLNGSSVNPKESEACLINSEDFDYAGEQPGKESSQPQIQQSIADQGSLSNTLSFGLEHDKNLFSGAHGSSVVAHSHVQNLNVAHHSAKEALAVSFRDHEAFGQSLNQSSRHPNYSLLHPVCSNNSKDTDLSRGVSAENVHSGSGVNAQQVTAVAGYQKTYGHDARARQITYPGSNVATQFSKFPASNIKMLNFSAKGGEGRSEKPSTLSLVQDTSPMIAADCCPSHSLGNNTGCNNVALNRTEQSQNNSQVAPSWFKHFGSLNNGQMLSMFDASVQQYPPSKPYDDLPMNASISLINAACPSQVNVWPTTGTTTTLSPSELSPHCMISPGVGDRGVSIMRSKKRKTSMYQLLPWHKEVTQGPRLQTIRKAEVAWSRAANRLTEKVGAMTDTIEDVSLVRPRKRLLLTPQLMQQIFSPAPAAILSADAFLSYGSVTYFAAKLALSDSCNLIFSRSDCNLSSNSGNQFSENSKASESTRELDFSKVAADLASRAKTLESNLVRLDKTLSLVDLKVECQELEKFAVINRFAKFHFRGQRKADENSLSHTASSNLRKPVPQRYVAAYPMPSAVPERAPCLPL